MKVRELIEVLRKMPQDAEAMTTGWNKVDGYYAQELFPSYIERRQRRTLKLDGGDGEAVVIGFGSDTT